MFESVCLVHYHEIGLKGKNRSTFENQLVTNLKRALRAFRVAEVSRISGYIVVETEDHRATKELQAAISQVPGVYLGHIVVVLIKKSSSRLPCVLLRKLHHLLRLKCMQGVLQQTFPFTQSS